MCVLYFGATIAPGVGVSGHLMVQTPSMLLQWAHAPGYGLLAWLFIRGLQQRHWPFPYAITVGSVAALLCGVWTEVFQGSVPGRSPSLDDVIVDAIGIGLTAVTIIYARRSQFLIFGRRLLPALSSSYSSHVMQEVRRS
jgi:hypothetical protein